MNPQPQNKYPSSEFQKGFEACKAIIREQRLEKYRERYKQMITRCMAENKYWFPVNKKVDASIKVVDAQKAAEEIIKHLL